ncbi:hypothetical protein GCM10017608_19090 [Agromyces luteolus]|uniref:Uncharacterized protein n=1 Tax=Agromyces luteolus TaxID=88373 RepID=A0A7C9LEH6_9MICO|nr:hypothetical protein [Agromyces luteolus]MUN08011.1 hypothetical protein [Agromyces luteolus]GLK27975.1 hypothetical protein GCM10017608_19090 [Agromyces luteolus]
MSIDAARSWLWRRPLAIAVLLVVSVVSAAGATGIRALGLDAEARAELTVERDRLLSEIDMANVRVDADRAMAEDADRCARDGASLLQPAVAEPRRFTDPTITMGTAAITRADVDASLAEPAAVVIELVEYSDASGPTRNQLVDEIHLLGDLRAAIGTESARMRLAAIERHAACESARRATAAVVADIDALTDRVVAASKKASAESVAELRSAREAVLAEAGDDAGLAAVPRWLLAASAAEKSHADAVDAEKAAAEEAARRAAEGAVSQPPSQPWRPPGEVPLPEGCIGVISVDPVTGSKLLDCPDRPV